VTPAPDVNAAPQRAELIEDAVGRLREALVILDVIDQAELLAVLPSEREAAERHQSGVSLLGVLRRELGTLAAELEASNQVHDLMFRLSATEELE
jgi:hypothetical protein